MGKEAQGCGNRLVVAPRPVFFRADDGAVAVCITCVCVWCLVNMHVSNNNNICSYRYVYRDICRYITLDRVEYYIYIYTYFYS